MSALPVFPGRPTYCPAEETLRWSVSGRIRICAKKNQPFDWFLLMLALPIFPGSHPPSIVGVHELNFCVRDGNRWILIAINTDYGDPCGNRTRVTGVRGRCLSRLTNEP